MEKTNNGFSPYGNDLFGQPIAPDNMCVTSKKFIVPPFTVLSARDGAWQSRKRAWKALGIRSEEGRDGGMLGIDAQVKWMQENGDGANRETNGTSVFDPVLCELVYHWFTKPTDQIVDPFAGGSVRGIVASCMGRKYWGGELRAEQVAANQKQALSICPNDGFLHWSQGDSLETLSDAPLADFIFSCPPYGDLEVYSKDDRDLSYMGHEEFLAAYNLIIIRALSKLKNHRFACFVVSDFRDKRGYCRDFVSSTIAAFNKGGAMLYNDAILVNPTGTAAMRADRQFSAGRKLIKLHQNVLVFCKGDWRKATEAARSGNNDS